MAQARGSQLMSSEHFTVDGTLIDAWASLKSFQPKDASQKERNERKRARKDRGKPKGGSGGGSNPEVNFRGERRSNETHESSTDPEARLARKGDGKEAKLSISAHALMENRNGVLVDLRVAEANGTAERTQALLMLVENSTNSSQIAVGADKGYDAREFVEQCRHYGITPHIAQNTSRRSAIDDRTTRHPGYAVSQRIRKRVEEIFGWAKTVGGFRRTRFRGIGRTQLAAYFVGAAYNLVRMARLLPTPA